MISGASVRLWLNECAVFRASRILVTALFSAALFCAPSVGASQPLAPPLVDHHQHLFSTADAELANSQRPQANDRTEMPVDGSQLIAMLDAAGIERAVVLSGAYYFDSPTIGRAGLEQVRLENDWTAKEILRFPDRLIGFCSFNPLRDYALEELDRCAALSAFKGVKLHFPSSGVDLRNAEHLQKVRRVFAAANSAGLALVVHMRSSRDYAEEYAEIFLNEVLSEAPDVPVQIAHLWGGGGFSEPALRAYADAVSASHPSTKRLLFDVAELARVVGRQPEMLGRRRLSCGKSVSSGSSMARTARSSATCSQAKRGR
jgi:predicted TIM-barrel fold metal-dependent hydrolase